MSKQVNEKELVLHLATKTKVDPQKIMIVLKHEQAYMNSAKADSKGDVDVDFDDLVDYIMGKSDVKLDEITVEKILDVEMEYLIKKGIAGYID
ncbi:hypothetical protein P4V43_02505 [Brevibacillus fortis]|uniref:Uncharacterized protein n=1 Tax=Brevibacillus fortis TaxID=2126352 RepID=A0A2P7UI30_9BACL|nr:hypothetical protein [Brevibacillus fortis]MED1780692.1 hypothetical protein [Brevibacillus fortis]PSJ86610.1 hypothetical protein C7R93_28290 [Brevibacillus fortis]